MQDKKPGVLQRNRLLVYVGTTLWIAWSAQMLVFNEGSSFLVAHPGHPWLQGALVFGYTLGAALLLTVGRALFSRCRLSSIVMGLSLACAALGAIGGIGLATAETFLPLLVALGVIMLIITVLWMNIVCVRSSAKLYGSMGATTVVGVAAGFCLSALVPSVIGGVASAAGLIASLICLVLATDSTLGADTMLVPHGEERAAGKPALFPARALVASGLVWGVLGFSAVLWSAIPSGIPFAAQCLLAAVGVMLAALSFAAVGSRYRNADKLGYAILGLMVACVSIGLYMLQAVVFPLEIALLLLAAGMALFHLYGKVLNLDLSYQAAESPLVTFAQASTVGYGSALIGGVLAGALPSAFLQLPLVSLAVLVLLAALISANATLFSRKNIGTRWGLVARQAVAQRDEEGSSGPSEQEQLRAAVGVVAAEGSLTPREVEVLELLVRGYRAKQIEAALGISLGTVRNHINHAYMKLGVHSYEEARALVEDRLSR